jgi:ABC-type uncharacterized transport system substrate-binding protein
MKMKITVLTLCAMLFALCFSASAQQPTKVPRIGWLTGGVLSTMSSRHQAFRQGLSDLGYVEGKNILIEWRGADNIPERSMAQAEELVRVRVDVIVTAGSGTTRTARAATSTIPIVMASDDDPVGNGFVASLDVLTIKDIEPAFRAAVKGRADAVLENIVGNIRSAAQKELAELALKNRLPVMRERPEHVEAGGLMSYGVNLNDLSRRAATYVDKILKGA